MGTEKTKTETERKPLTTGEHVSLVKRAHNRGQSALVDAGLAVIAAEEAGALYFDRTAPEGSPDGAMSRKQLAEHLKCSPTLVSKYRAIGRLVRMGVDRSHTDWGLAERSAIAKWMTEALETGNRAKVEKALAEHRPGSQTRQGGQTNGQTSGSTRAAQPDKGVTPVKRATLEETVTAVHKWIMDGEGQRLDSISKESRTAIVAMLREAADRVESRGVDAPPVTPAKVA